MRHLGLIAITVTGLGLSGCSQLSNPFSKRPHYHTADNSIVYTDTEDSLRTTPQQSYQFSEQSYGSASQGSTNSYHSVGTEYTYASPSTHVSQYAGYDIELYNSQPSYSAAAFTNPRDTEFVKLNGESEILDWQNCETRNRGYLFMSEYEFSLNPGFEVCMRNLGYVKSTEYGPGSKQVLNAETARLRGLFSGSTTSRFFP